MSKDKETVAAGSDISDKALLALFDNLPGQEISLERNIYKAASCAPYPVVGFMIDHIQMPDADRAENPEWTAFLVELTHPTKVINRNGEVIMAKKGDEIWVPANFQVAGALGRFALDPTTVHELAIQPEAKMQDIGGGKKMRRFRVKMTGQKRGRTFQYQLDKSSLGRALPPAPTTSDGTAYDGATGEIPAGAGA